ncbi:MAG TPA: hypothetical protein VF912_10875 [Anaeromyxobacter sp.]
MCALALLSCSVASPATEVKEALARAAPLEVDAGGARIAIARAVFADVAVSVDAGRALVVAVVDADGRVSTGGSEVRVGYVGREAFEMERCPRTRWCAAGAPLPALAGVVEALAAAPRPDGRRPVAWQIRVERDRATVGEDALAPDGARAPRGVLALVRDGVRWRLTSP